MKMNLAAMIKYVKQSARSVADATSPYAYLGSRLPRVGSALVRLTLFPVLQWRWHPSAYRYMREFRKYEYAPIETIRAVQWQRLKDLLQHATEHVPYYRELFRNEGISVADIRSPEDFARIPVLSKAALRDLGGDMCADNVKPQALQLNASGGSTGKPVRFYQDARYWDYALASQWFVEGWWGIRPGDSTASIWGTDRDLPSLHWKERLAGKICQLKICNAFALSENRLEEFARELNRWQPRFVIGYASALYLFARFLRARPSLAIRPTAVKSTAEVLSDEERAVIEEAFQCPVYNFYGSREVNNLAAECQARNGLHVNALTRYLEVTDEAGQSLRPGIPGKVLVTDLTNYAMPFVRYENEDIASWNDTPCSCGRPFPRLAGILGRKSDFIVTSDGKLIHGEFFTHMFYANPHVAQFQILQDSPQSVRMRVVLLPGAADSLMESLRRRLGEVLGQGVNCNVEVVERIEAPPSGKHRFAVSSVPIPWGVKTRSPGTTDGGQ